MKKMLVATAILFMGCHLCVNAKQKNNTASSFKPGWSVGANGGMNMFMGEGNNFLNPNKPYVFTPSSNGGFQGRLSAGYNFSPVIGLKGMLGYNQYKWSTVPQSTNGSYPYSQFSSEKLTTDLMVNLSNWWIGYNPSRKMDFSLFLGAGAAYLNKNASLDPFALVGRGGLQGDYHLTPELDINMIIEGNLTSDNYNDLANKPLVVDAIPAVTIGIAYRLPAKEKKVAKTPVHESKTELVEKSESTSAIAESKKDTVVKQIIDQKVDVKEQIAQTETKTEKTATETINIVPNGSTGYVAALNEKVFFNLNSAYISEMINKESIREIAEYVKQHPDAIITVSGYADKSTGSIDGNNMMSKMRAVNVANTLIRYYGVSYKNIVVKWYGGGVQPYRTPAKNRLVIVKSPASKNGVSVDKAPKADNNVQNEETLSPLKLDKPEASRKDSSAAVAPYDLFTTINFTDNCFEIQNEKQEAAIMKIALYMRKYPKTRILVSGYADKSTGSADKNNELSKKRAVTIANTLIQKYSINYDRIQTKWFGGEKQAYTAPSMNRLVLVETLK